MSAERFDSAAANLGMIGSLLTALPGAIKAKAQEIRLRCGRPVMLSLPEGGIYVTKSLKPALSMRPGLLYAGRAELNEAFRLICGCSVHSHQREIKNGFVVLAGGHRAGICGTAVTDGDTVTNIRDISSINLRIARDIDGAASGVAAVITRGENLRGTLVFGPPGCGKTTVLRDLARRLSNGAATGRQLRVAIVDERGEIAATSSGSPQNDLGPCCDVLDGYPKGEGIMQAVRCLSPDVVICDEIGGNADARAISQGVNSGVTVIASAHADNARELCSRPQIAELIRIGAFEKGVWLKGRDEPGKIAGISDLKEYLQPWQVSGGSVYGGVRDGFENFGDMPGFSGLYGYGDSRRFKTLGEGAPA